MTLTNKNIYSALENTGLYSFNLELVIQKFTKKISSRPSSSESGASIIPGDDWKRFDKLVRAALQLQKSVSHLTTENILLKDKIARLERALLNAMKCSNKKKPLLLGLPSENDGGVLFMSPSKVQQARDIISQKEEQAA